MATLQLEIPDQQAAALKEYAQSRGLTLEQWLLQLAGECAFSGSVEPENVERSITARKPHISEVIRRIWSDLPEDARAKLRHDGASQVDHYVYGLSFANSEG
ncbi:MAG: hypothetical protein JO097_19740 [Acidobacteriaceae bacterium]|nr:hypothetical protein [Acidobacteriaceae bacterium]MBV9296397.1 hypothetical protein [Acidobacteriaceae bacterium]MBV9764911.1 hypothetical protein [Acidobacteriaceae bacterium]